MSSIFGKIFKISSFGESHGQGLGVIIDGVPSGIKLNSDLIQKDLDKRKPGTSEFVSQRKESDTVEILSGVSNDKTLGSPIALLVRNKDARSKDYKNISKAFRPGHADITYFMKYGLPPQPGGGRSSGRETLARVAAGAVAKAILKPYNVTINAYTIQIGSLKAKKIDPDFAENNPLRCADPDMAVQMAEMVKQIRADNDSIGGIIQIVIDDVPKGLGEPVFHKLDANLAGALMSIGAVKGVEFGAGFSLAEMKGSQANDPISKNGFLSNNAGGILGGISNGNQIKIQIVVKPTPSISQKQKTIDIDGNETIIEIKGRHDPCICPRICPVAEAMCAIVIADALLILKSKINIGGYI